MARRGDLPRPLSAVHERQRVPHRAQLAVGVAVAVLVSVADLRGAIGFSSFTVLVYYAIANASALTLAGQPGHLLPVRSTAVVGLVGCVALAVALPWRSVVAGLAVLAIGALGFWIRRLLIGRT